MDDQVATKANVSHTHNASDINAGTLSVIRGGTGQSSFVNGELLIGNTTGNTLAKATLTGTPNRLLVTNGAGSITLNVDATDANTADKVVARNASGNFSAGTITAALSGNATTATTLQTARTLTIGSSGKTFNGGANVTWTLAEIGAAADSAVVKLTGTQSVAGAKTFSDITTVSNTTQSTTTSNGALIVSGGLSVAKTINAGEDAYINGVKVGRVNGTNNIVIGNAITARSISSSNSGIFAIGANAMQNPTANVLGNTNMALGTGAMYWHGSVSTPGTDNVAVGSYALQFVSTGIRNCGLGTLALTAASSGGSNTGVGFYALLAVDTGSNNVGIGSQSGGALTGGGSNICIGTLSLGAVTNGSLNVAIGNQAGWKQNNGSTDATGLDNCIFIGASARSNGNNQANQIVIGFQALGEGNDTTVIGNSFTKSTHLEGSIKRNAPVTKTANFTLGDRENWVINNKPGSSCIVTLPAASSWTGREVMFKNIQAQTLVSASSNVVPRAGGAAGTAILAANAGAWATLVSDGTNWIIMQGP